MRVDLRSIRITKGRNNVVHDLLDNDVEINSCWSGTVTGDRGCPMPFRENSCSFGNGGGSGLASSTGTTHIVSHCSRRNADRGG